MPDTKFPQNATLERDLAAGWQLPRRELARHRTELSEGADWWRRGRAIVYGDGGIEKMRCLLGLNGEVSIPRQPRQVAIKTDRRIRNPRLIEAQYEDKRILVRVRDQSLYVPGMLVLIRRDGPGWAEAVKPKRKGVPNVTPEELEQLRRDVG
tara:strand:- start:3605 stop:4060 length:456 start_codon:yes stop_codon:yes gene_type:complete